MSADLKILRQSFIDRLFDTTVVDSFAAAQQCEKYKIPVPKEHYVVSAVMPEKLKNITPDDMTVFRHMLKLMLDDTCSDWNGAAFWGEVSNGVLAVLFETGDDDAGSLYYVRDTLQSLQEQFASATNLRLYAGISAFGKGIEHISYAARQAYDMLCCRAWMNESSIIIYNDVDLKASNFALSMKNNEIDEFTDAVARADIESCKGLCRNYFGRISGSETVNLHVIQNNIAEMITIVIRSVFGEAVRLDSEIQNYSPFIDFMKYIDIKELENHTFDILCNLCSLVEKRNENTESTVKSALDIIHKEYMNDLTVNSLAKRTFVSPRGLMYMFKSELGQTIHGYITKYRIQMALKLIEGGNYKIYEICELVGYPDPNYFSQIFKKHVGMPPKKYIKDKKEGKV